MKKILFLIAFFFHSHVLAGTYEEIEMLMTQRQEEKVIELVRRGIDINTVDRSGNTFLIQAVRQDMPQLVDFLLEKRARLNNRNRYGETALSIAAFNGNLHYTRRLVEAGADVNYYGWSPLIYAAFNGHTAIVEYLLKYGARIDAQTENGSTALYVAARNGHVDALKKLIEHKANPTLANNYNETPLDAAKKSGNAEIENILRKVVPLKSRVN